MDTTSGATVLYGVTWTRDNSGRILTVDETTPGITGFDWASTYDEAGRLTIADNTDGPRD